jgi:hypothetical protein
MTDAQRYRMNAAECLSAAEPRESPYHDLAFTIAAYWLSLARQQEAVDEFLGKGSGPQRRISAGRNFRLMHTSGPA